jgi:hypothetical protein
LLAFHENSAASVSLEERRENDNKDGIKRQMATDIEKMNRRSFPMKTTFGPTLLQLVT